MFALFTIIIKISVKDKPINTITSGSESKINVIKFTIEELESDDEMLPVSENEVNYSYLKKFYTIMRILRLDLKKLDSINFLNIDLVNYGN